MDKCLIILIAVFLCACNRESPNAERDHSKSPSDESYHNKNALIEAGALYDSIQAGSDIQIIDIRSASEFAKGHIPQAVHISKKKISDSTSEIKGIRASIDQIESLLSNAGISSEERIYIYDDDAGCNAARLWWVLYSYGFRNCSILNGGWTAWLAENQPVSIEYTKRKNAVFKFSSSDALAVINYQKVLEASEKGNAVILDTRSIDEFCGNVRSSECKKSGRIPGSIFMDWSYAVDYHGNKKFKTRAELMNLFSHIGVDADREILTYCRSGVRSAHTSFVLQELLGYHHVKNYDGSWIEWSSIDHLPVQQDSIERVR